MQRGVGWHKLASETFHVQRRKLGGIQVHTGRREGQHAGYALVLTDAVIGLPTLLTAKR
jgi:hypothetical protein